MATLQNISWEYINSGNLFVGIKLDPETASRVFHLGAQVREKLGFHHRPRPAEVLHISLHAIDPGTAITTEHLHAAREACEKASGLSSPFDVRMDQAMSFGGKENKALVFTQRDNKTAGGKKREDGRKNGERKETAKNDNAELKAFHQALGRELKHKGFRVRSSFTPHVTIAYGPQVDPQPIGPLTWRINEIALILSHVGETRYSLLGCWQLTGTQPATIEEPPSQPKQSEFGFEAG